MTGPEGMGSTSLLVVWVLFLLACGVGASSDTELLMQAPFAHSLNWTAQANLCHSESTTGAANIICDADDNVTHLWIVAPGAANVTLPHGWGSLTHLAKLTVTGAAGTLPPDWGTAGSFPHLEELWLYNSSLNGSLPSGWGSKSSFPKLQQLGLNNNSISGTLPAEWGNNGSFPVLQFLSLGVNNLGGSLPAEWGNVGSFPVLKELLLHNNSLTGILSPGWGSNGSFPQLQKLYLYNNSLTGSLPPGWGSMGSFPVLQWLGLSGNSLSGSLPGEWGSVGSFPKLQEMDLCYNSLSGSLPGEWGSVGSFPELHGLVLSYNSFKGSLPGEWGSVGSFPELHVLGLSYNSFMGSLPGEWGSVGSFVNLQTLDLSCNFLSGSLPAEWGSEGSFPLLQALFLGNNTLSDILPSGWGSNGSLPGLRALDVSYNSLRGNLPGGWGSNGAFPLLGLLYLHNNFLSGSLPAGWGGNAAFPVLHVLSLYNNSLTGSLPAEWGNSGSFPQLEMLRLESNFLSGSLPSGWATTASFPLLVVLSLSSNSLSGSLPAGWGSNGSFPLLQALDLSFNSLNGSLPVEWGVPAELNIPALQKVPATILALPFRSLYNLLLWNNNFSGGVPLDWTNNPRFISGRVVLSDALFKTSKESPAFAKGICMNPFRYEHYMKWSIGILVRPDCDTYLQQKKYYAMPDSCFIPAAKTVLDPCALDNKTRAALIAPWTCFGLILLLVCMKERAVALLDRSVPGFSQTREKAMGWVYSRLSPSQRDNHKVLLGMVASVILFWADHASDVPVLLETLENEGPYFYVLLTLLLGSHILDAVLIAMNAVAKGVKEPGPALGPSTLFSRVSRQAACFMMYFMFAALALPALDVRCLVKGPSKDKSVDDIFEVNIAGYQAMRLVIGAVFRTVPTAIVLSVIVALGNKPDNGTFFTPTVVGVSLSLSALQVINAILQIRQWAIDEKQSKLKLLWSVFTLKALALPPSQSPEAKAVEADPVGTGADAKSQREGWKETSNSVGCPTCEGTGLLRPRENEP